jgi:hypothetical protein
VNDVLIVMAAASPFKTESRGIHGMNQNRLSDCSDLRRVKARLAATDQDVLAPED